jgi:hypothetical protein
MDQSAMIPFTITGIPEARRADFEPKTALSRGKGLLKDVIANEKACRDLPGSLARAD